MAGGQAQPQAAPQNPAADGFLSERLARVRTQLERLDALVTAELDRGNEADGQRVDRLVAASARLEEQERRLSNRSLPPPKRSAETPRRSKLGGCSASDSEGRGGGLPKSGNGARLLGEL